MIVSASRRTDIPAFYGEWFRRRLEAGFCLVPNPFNRRQVTRVSLARRDVRAFVFWTRDPTPFLGVLDELERRGYPSVFLMTLTGYGPPLEPGSPSAERAVTALHSLADRIGPERVVWRYDPIVLGRGLDPGVHRERFADLAGRLGGATKAVKISFVDLYRKTTRRLAALEDGASFIDGTMSEAEIGRLVEGLAQTAARCGMRLETCAEERDFSSWGAAPGACIEGAMLSRLFGDGFPSVKNRGQRRCCRCAPSRDIGMTQSCLHGCVYCYATSSHEAARRNRALHDPAAPSLLPLPGYLR